MKWETRLEEEELEEKTTDPMQEKIWSLHDKLSDAIHSVSRSHYLRSRHVSLTNGPDQGFVFCKEPYVAEVREAKSLNGIRAALENLEDHLHFFHNMVSSPSMKTSGAPCVDFFKGKEAKSKMGRQAINATLNGKVLETNFSFFVRMAPIGL